MEAPKHVPALRQRKASEEPRAGLLKRVRAHVPPQGRTCSMKEGYRGRMGLGLRLPCYPKTDPIRMAPLDDDSTLRLNAQARGGYALSGWQENEVLVLIDERAQVEIEP